MKKSQAKLGITKLFVFIFFLLLLFVFLPGIYSIRNFSITVKPCYKVSEPLEIHIQGPPKTFFTIKTYSPDKKTVYPFGKFQTSSQGTHSFYYPSGYSSTGVYNIFLETNQQKINKSFEIQGQCVSQEPPQNQEATKNQIITEPEKNTSRQTEKKSAEKPKPLTTGLKQTKQTNLTKILLKPRFKSFSLWQHPRFLVNFTYKRTGFSVSSQNTNLQSIKIDLDERLKGKVKTVFQNKNLELVPLQNIQPGCYQLKMFRGNQSQEIWFSWGLVSVNTEKPIYRPGEEAKIWMVVLDRHGYPVEGANVTLRITDHENNSQVFSTFSGTVKETGKGIYEARYRVRKEGNHTLWVLAEADDVVSEFESHFLSKKSYHFDILRETPMVIDPKKGWFESKIKIVSYIPIQNFTLKEYLPKEFQVKTNAEIVKTENKTVLKWENLSNGSWVSYKFSVPWVWPYLYEFGPAKIVYQDKIFQEARPWYLAIDPSFNYTEHLIDSGTNVYRVMDIEVLDFDKDGDLDFVACAYGSDEINWWSNQGDNQTFTNILIQDTPNTDGVKDIEVLDFDGDGDYDVVYAAGLENRIAWLENSGNNQTFTDHEINESATYCDNPSDIEVLDFDRDGDYDVVAALQDDDEISWFRNEGDDLTFTKVIILRYNANLDGVRDIEVLDFDRDGDYDIGYAATLEDRIAWLRNSGDNQTFTDIQVCESTLTCEDVRDIEVTDFDKDGDYDIVAAVYSDRRISWWENSGDNQTFTEHVIAAGIVYAEGINDVEVGDMDGDGDYDVVVSLYLGDKLAWWKNSGNNLDFEEETVIQSSSLANGAWTTRIIPEFESNGIKAIVLASYDGNRLAWWEPKQKPEITILSPNETSQSKTVLLNFTVYDLYSTTLECWYSLNGELTYIGSVTNGTYYNTTVQAENNKIEQNLTVICQNSFTNSSETVLWSAHPFSTGWSYRIPINITENSGENLTEYQIMLSLDTETLVSQGKLQNHCNDTRFTFWNSSLGIEQEIPYFLDFNCNQNDTTFWVKIPWIPANGNATIYFYYGNPNASSESNEPDVFSYSNLEEIYYVIDDTAAGKNLNITALEDNTLVKISNISMKLNSNGTDTYEYLSQGMKIHVTKPILGRPIGDVVDTISPISWAGKNFTVACTRATDSWNFYSPFANTTVRIYSGSGLTPLTTVNVEKGSYVNSAQDISGDNARIEADDPVLVFHSAGSDDAFALYPASTDLYGVSSNYAYLTAFYDNTQVTVYWSDGSTSTLTRDRGSYTNLGNGATQGTGLAGHVVADKPVMVIQQADSDGVESTVWLPLKELDTKFVLPTDAQYVAIACPYSNTQIQIYYPNGSLQTQGSCGSNQYPYPNKFWYGNSTVGSGSAITMRAGTRIIASKSVYLYYEHKDSVVTDGDETNTLSYKQARKRAYYEPSSFEGEEEQSEFNLSSPTTYDSSYQETQKIPINHTVIIRINATQTLGDDKISWVRITLKHPNGTVMVNNESMTAAETIQNGYIYEYNYTIPDSLESVGDWVVEIYGEDVYEKLEFRNTSFFAKETAPPQWGNFGANETNPAIEDWVEFFAYWTDNYNLTEWVFSWNATVTGYWDNITSGNFTGTGNWSNTSLQIPTYTAGKTIAYRFYAKDFSANWNSTELGTLEVQSESDTEPPVINVVYATPKENGYGMNITIVANVTDNIGVDSVIANVTYPNGTYFNFSLEFDSSTLNNWSKPFQDTWQPGTYNFTIWANDTSGNTNQTTITYNFSVQVNLWIDVVSKKDIYGPNQDIQILDSSWWNRSWGYRMNITINNSASQNLEEYQLRIEVPTQNIQDKIRSDCNDLRFTWYNQSSEKEEEIPYWLEKCNSSGTSIVWVKLPFVPSSSTKNITIYYGNPDAESMSNLYGVFSFSSPQSIYYELSDNVGSSSLQVASYADSNQIVVGASSTTLDRQETYQFSVSQGTVINATKPISGKTLTASGTDSITPISFASTRFGYPYSRGTDEWNVHSPFGNANVTIYNYNSSGSLLGSQSFYVPKGSTQNLAYDVSLFGIVESNVSILVEYNPGSIDSEVLYPASYELYGVSSGNAYVGAFEENTVVKIYRSDGTYISTTLDRGEYTSTGGGGSQGTGDGIHIVADKPVVATSQADADGSESVAFWGPKDLNTEYIIPTDTQYFSIVCPESGTTIYVYNPDGTLNESKSCGSNEPPYPNQVAFGNFDASNDYISYYAGTLINGTKPFYLYYEYSTEDETSCTGPKQVRKLVLPEPTYSFSSEDTPEALVRNSGSTNSSGYVTMYIESNISGSWEWVSTQINDSQAQTKREVNESLDLTQIWNTNPWNTDSKDSGYYRLVTLLTDPDGNILTNQDSSQIINYTVFYVDIQAPVWNNLGVNDTNPKPEDWVKFYCNWSDNGVLDSWIFQWNISGNFENASFGTFTSNPDWSNTSLQIPSSQEAHTIAYRFIANDTEGSQNITDVYTLYVQDITPPTVSNTQVSPDFIHRNETVNITATVTDNVDVNTSWSMIGIPGNGYENLTMEGNVDLYNLTYKSQKTGIYNVTVYANDSYNNIGHGSTQFWTVYGWADIHWISPQDGEYPIRSVLTLVCQVLDSNTSEAIQKYPVTFWKDGNQLGTNTTNSTGYATYTWDTTGESEGEHILNCTIQDNSSLFYNASINNANTNITILVPSFQVIQLKHENQHECGINEYESGDTIDWMNVTINNTGGAEALWVNVSLNVLDSSLSQTSWFSTQVKQCGNLSAGETCEVEFSSEDIPTNTVSGNYTWNVTIYWQGGGSPPDWNRSVNFTIHNLPSNFSSSINPDKINQNQSSVYNITIYNPWLGNLTKVNITINCPSENMTCVCLGTSQGYCELGNITPLSVKTASFNISTNSSTEPADYPINATVNYTNPGLEERVWEEQQTQMLRVRGPTNLSVNITLYPETVTRGSLIQLRGYVNNTGALTTNVWLNWTLPNAWSNYSGNLNVYNETLCSLCLLWNNITVNVSMDSKIGENSITLTSESSEQSADWDTKTIYVYANTTLSDLQFNPPNPNRNETVWIQAKLVLDNSTPVSGEPVGFYINNTLLGTNTTDSQGYVNLETRIPYNLSLGRTTITAEYSGSSEIYTNPSSVFRYIVIKDTILISDITVQPNHTGYGMGINISANVTSFNSLDSVKANISNEYQSFLINLLPDNGLYKGSFNSTWDLGNHSVVIIANNTGGYQTKSSPQNQVVGETGTFTLTNTMENGYWETIQLNHCYENPIVIAGPLLHNNDESLIIRVSNITSCNFTLTMQWANQTVNSQSYTPSPESGYYLVVEEGIWELEDGSKIEARYTETNSTYDNHTWLLEPDGLKYELSFTQPIVFATIQTAQDTKWGFAYVFDVNITTHTFNITIAEGETSQGIRNIEKLGYIVLEGGLTSTLENKLYETQLTSETIEGHDDGCYNFSFQQTYSQTPLIVGNLQTFNGADAGFLRICLLNSTTVGFHVDEDRVYDSERTHTAESAGFIAFEDNLTLFAKPYEFNITSNASVYVKTFKPVYGPNQDVLLTGISWFNSSWKHRKKITVSNPNPQKLEEYQIELNLNLTQLYQEGKLQSQCQDVRFTWFNSSSLTETEIPYYIENCNTSGGLSRIWFKTIEVPENGSETVFYMYYGNPSAQDNSSLENVFSYSEPRLVGYVVSSILADSTLDVVSLADGNNITVGGASVSLNKQESTSFSGLSQNTSILAKKPFQADSITDVTDMISPISWAGKEFYYYSYRGTNQFSILSPFGTANVNIYDAGTLVWTGQVGPSGALVEKDIVSGHVVRISSDLPILVQHHADAENYDALLYYPATSDYLYGTPSQRFEIGSGPNGASVSWVDSNGTTGGTSLSANTGYDTGSLGGSGGAPPRRVKGSYPIAANQIADDDGTEATTFLPYKELGTLFGSHQGAEYIAIAAPEPNTTCTLYNSSGGVVSTQTGGTRTDVNKICFNCGGGTQYVGSNWLMVCDKPVHAYYEKVGESDETNLFSWKQMRQYIYPEPQYDVSEEEEISKIHNFDTVNTSGYVLMKIQNNQSGVWTDTETVVNETFKRFIQNNTYLNLAEIWDSKWNTGSQPAGYYRVITYFRDPQGNILLNDNGSSITGYDVFYLDTEPPQWSSFGINNTKPKPGDWVKFFAYWTDNYNLSHWSFYWNCTEFGSWVEVASENFTSNPDWSNLTLEIPSFASGMYGYKFYAWDDFGNQNVTDTGTFWIPGDLQVDLILPPTIPGDGEANWTTGYLVGWNRTFRINATVACEGGPCGHVNATLRYNGSSSEPDTPVPTSEDKPFYIMSGSNPAECGELQDGDSCNVSWLVNATGDLHSLWKMDVLFSSNLSESNQTNITSIYTGIILIVNVGFQDIYFGIVNPDNEFYLYPAYNNSDDYYNVTVHSNSNDVEGLWIKGTDLTNGTPSYNTMINVSHAKWSLTNLGDHPGPPQPANMYNLSYEYDRINKDMQVIPAGTNETLYFWIDAPKGVYPRLYTGTLWIMANSTD